MEHDIGSFKTADGMDLFEQRWRPEQKPKALVVIVHGYAEHSTRYTHVAEHLVDHGYAVETFDLRGHGQSEGKRAFVGSFDAYLEDLEQFLKRVRQRIKTENVFILGHSMGGAIVTLYAITRKPDITGLILSGPALKISDDISPLLVRLSSVIGIVLPKLPTIKLDSSGISRDPEVVKHYDNDPLVYRGGIPARTGAEITGATKMIQAQMEAMTLPLLILHGGDDRLADPQGSKSLYERAQSNDKTLKLYEGLYHEVMNEPEKDMVLADIVAWTDGRV
ncbi:MAG: alpha/beta hydrolase [Deltaproteobacteria bacterium]|nr:alpha/beta hydrolase [Deltaproteobacteria bacterium]